MRRPPVARDERAVACGCACGRYRSGLCACTHTIENKQHKCESELAAVCAHRRYSQGYDSDRRSGRHRIRARSGRHRQASIRRHTTAGIGSERSGATEARIAHYYTGRITGSARTTRSGYAETYNDVGKESGSPPDQPPWMVCRSDAYTRQRLSHGRCELGGRHREWRWLAGAGIAAPRTGPDIHASG